jgi:hypothetical protein
MKPFMQPARKAEAVRRGLAAFFVAAGLLVAYGATSVLTTAVALMLGLPSILLGIGIWRHWFLARWAAMGVCFLMVIGAFAVPLIVTLPIAAGDFANPARVEFMSWAFAGAFGLLGFWGLQYFRSPAAKGAFARSAEMRAAFKTESPSIVVTSALLAFTVWLMPVGMVWSEQWAPGRTRAAGSGRQVLLPDLVVTGLCLRGDSMVHAEIANRGQSSSSRKFSIAYSSLRIGGGGGGSSLARVPRAGTVGLVGLDRAINPFDTENEGLDVRLSVDSTDQVRESDEDNNKARFPIVFKFYHPGNLPPCPKLPEINGR